ncbi:outer membrane protein [Paracoccaceae bacterium GXU_MW_L88]
MPSTCFSAALAASVLLATPLLANPLTFAKPYVGVVGGWQSGEFEWEQGEEDGDGLAIGLVAGANILTYDISDVINQLGPVYLVGFEVSGFVDGPSAEGVCGSGWCEAEADYSVGLALRAGIAWDRALMFGKIGYRSTDYEIKTSIGGQSYSDDLRIGTAVIGAGGDFQIAGNLLGRLEIEYAIGADDDYELAGQEGSLDAGYGGVRAGLLYQF